VSFRRRPVEKTNQTKRLKILLFHRPPNGAVNHGQGQIIFPNRKHHNGAVRFGIRVIFCYRESCAAAGIAKAQDLREGLRLGQGSNRIMIDSTYLLKSMLIPEVFVV